MGSGVQKWSPWGRVNRPVWLLVVDGWDVDTQKAKMALEYWVKRYVQGVEDGTDVGTSGEGQRRMSGRWELLS